MVEDPKDGIISILDEQCSRPNGSDAALLAHLDAALKKKDRFSSFQKNNADKVASRHITPHHVTSPSHHIT